MRRNNQVEDVVIVGGGPAGLSAALVLGRGCKRVVLCDAGAPRNERAEHMHGFVSRDGIPPSEFRMIGREQLEPYDVEVRSVRVERIERDAELLAVSLSDGAVLRTRRVLLATGMIDEHPSLPGWRDLWGQSIFQCPYCHGWEIRDRAWGVLASEEIMLDFARFVTGWAKDVIVFTNAKLKVSADRRAQLQVAGVGIEERPITALISGRGDDDRARLEAIQLADGARITRDALFARPPQRHVDVVRSLGLAQDEQGFVRVNEQKQTSEPGIYAAGDLTTPIQGAMIAAHAGAVAAYSMNHLLNLEAAGGMTNHP